MDRIFHNPERNSPWPKFRIGIHSDLIRTIPNHSGICIRANANQSELIRKKFLMSFVENRSKNNPSHSDPIRTNPN